MYKNKIKMRKLFVDQCEKKTKTVALFVKVSIELLQKTAQNECFF